LTSAERNYSTTEKECLAIVWEIFQLRPYLEGQKFIIRTDHHSLRWVLNLADAQGRLARWRFRLLEFDFEVQYAPGRGHHGADTMSRLRAEDAEPVDGPVDAEIPCFMVSPDEEPSLIHVKDVLKPKRKIPNANNSLHPSQRTRRSISPLWGWSGTSTPQGNLRCNSPLFSILRRRSPLSRTPYLSMRYLPMFAKTLTS
jgi:RNase H-like domain found in reverse transcriptase